MSLSDSELARIALKTHHWLSLQDTQRLKHFTRRLQDAISYTNQLDKQRRQFETCTAKGWTGAVQNIEQAAARSICELSTLVVELQKGIASLHAKVLASREILGELQQLQREFGEVKYEPKPEILSVTTDPIELEGIYLGPFEIQLHLPSLVDPERGEPCRVVALDPNPSAKNGSVTHPHVSDERLCPGEARTAISAALTGGRICDFFMLVQSVLSHYNPESPYVALDQWQGVECYECGYLASSESSYYCEGCERDFCEGCISYCEGCDTSLCVHCISSCAHCGVRRCESCLESCQACLELYCPDCLDQGYCPDCKEKVDEELEEEDTGNVPTGAEMREAETIQPNQTG